VNGAPWETISELFSFVAIQKPTRTQPKVLEFVKCQSINGALACAPQATARQVELRQKCQSINGALACAPCRTSTSLPTLVEVSVDQWRAGLRAPAKTLCLL